MINFLLGCLLIQPWIFIPNINIANQFRLPQALMMDIMFLGIIASSFYKGNRFVYRNKYLFWMLGWMFLNFIFYYFLPFSLEYKTGRILNTAALEPVSHIILGLFAVTILLCNIDREELVRIARVICFSGILISLFSILQFSGFDPMKLIAVYNCDNRISACLDNPNVVGNYLALCLPLFLMFSEKKFRAGMVIIISGILVTKCHFAIILMLIGMVTFFMAKYRKNKWSWVALVSLVLISIPLLINSDFAKLSSNMSSRLSVWKIGIEHLKDNVIFGQGIGVWKTWMVRVSSTFWFSCHNDWLERTIEMGLPWLIFAIIFVVHTLRNVNLQDELGWSYLSMFVVFLVMMFGSFPFETPTIAVLGLMSFIGVERS